MIAMATDVRRNYTFADLERMPADGRRYEILAGELLVTPAPNTRHQRVVVEITALLNAFAKKSGGVVLVAPVDVRLSDTDVVEPDVLYLSPMRAGAVRERFVDGPPDLVVEVLSAGTAHVDRGRKRELYRASGVREYWVVDVDERLVELHDFHANVTRLLTARDRLVSTAAAGFSADVAELFATLPSA